jgi:hypothetical protein
MRPYLILTAVVLMAVAAFGQQPVHPTYGSCFYGCAPYVPLLTTPMLSLQTVSSDPVGASNATAGLVAGATNSTLSESEGSTSASYTVPVWYQGGGAPLISPDVNLSPIGHDMHPMHDAMHEDHGKREEAHAGWTFFSGRERTVTLGNVAKGKKADHVYTNDDITRENDKNGEVKYDGKSGKIQ